MKKMYKKLSGAKEYFKTVVFIFLAVCFFSVPDYVYYNTDLWMPGKMFGGFCSMLRRLGVSYTGLLEALEDNLGIFVTAISVVITMSVNNLNRSESKLFGLTRNQFDFSKRQTKFRYGRRMVFAAPCIMIGAVVFRRCILGYAVLAMCYLFLILVYYWFESSFSKEKDLVCIGTKLLETVPQTVQDSEEITEYLKLLNIMSQWNDREKDWEGVSYLFRDICGRARECDTIKMCILCWCSFEMMYVQGNEQDCTQAIYALRNYIAYRDKEGWKETDHLVLWGMMHCLLSRCQISEAVHFIRWYLDFPARSRRAVVEHGETFGQRFGMNITRQQTGILMIEMELFLHNHYDKNNNGDYDYILEKLPQMWNEGKGILTNGQNGFRELFLNVNAILNDIDTYMLKKRLENLCLDYQYNTKRSLLVSYLKYE